MFMYRNYSVMSFAQARNEMYADRLHNLISYMKDFDIDYCRYKYMRNRTIKDRSYNGLLENGDFTLVRSREEFKRAANSIPLERLKYYRGISVNNRYKEFMMKDANSLVSSRSSYHMKTVDEYYDKKSRKRNLQALYKMTEMIGIRSD